MRHRQTDDRQNSEITDIALIVHLDLGPFFPKVAKNIGLLKGKPKPVNFLGYYWLDMTIK